MGLDNGFDVKSNRRKITRADLPESIQYPFEKDYGDEAPEIIYHRKDWGWRNSIMRAFGWYSSNPDQWSFDLETPDDVLKMIEITAAWLDKEAWETEGDSIWEYEEIRSVLVRDIANLAIIYGYMLQNPDVYLQFYDSY